MATTYSTSLKLALIGEGDQSGIWGQTTNTNLGTLLEQAITGVQTITMIDANYTLTNFNGVTNEARNAVLVVTGTNNAIRDLIPPIVEKLYTIVNNTAGGYAIRVIGGSGTGVSVPNGATCLVYCDGTNFVNGLSGAAGNFSVAGALSVTSTANLGGAITYGGVTLSNAVTGTGNMVLSASPTLTGTPTAPTASPGTNTTQIATTAFVTAATGTLGTMSTQNANAVAITGGTITGITDLTVADGGTGASTFTANSVVLGNGTSALNANMVAPGTSGNVLTSNGTTWTSTAVPGGLGVGQTWTNVSGSRAFGTSYTNSTGKPIVVAIVASQTPGGAYLGATVDGVGPIPMGTGYSAGGTYTTSGTVVIPVGATYSVTPQVTAGTTTLSAWYELR
jgi:hypothetical protein